MKNDYSHEKILIVISLVLFAGIIFYNAFFIPEVVTPSVIYVDKDNTINDEVEDINENSNSDSTSEDDTNSDTNENSNNDTTQTNANKNHNTDIADTSGSNNSNKDENTDNSNQSSENSQNNADAATNSEVLNDASKSEKSNSINGKVNINTATKEELAENIPGVGDSIAERIIEYRNYNGDFSSIEEIKNVSGIGDKKFESMKDAICV